VKWIAAILMIVNVAVFLWASGRQDIVEEIKIVSSPDVNKQGMLLLSEASGIKRIGVIEESLKVNQPEDDAASQSSAEQPATGDNRVTALESGDELIVAEDLIEDGEPVVASTAATADIPDNRNLSCYRIGPFRKDDPWKSALAWLDEQQIPFKHVTSESRELRAVRVFLGPFTSASKSEAAVRELKKKNLDHFVYEIEEGTTRVSLGYFTQEALATKFLGYLKTIDVEASSQPEFRTLGPFNWLEISVEGTNLDQLTGHNWKANNIGLSRVDC